MATPPQATGPLSEENAFSRFFKALFEFSFKEFVTPKLISILYGISLTGIGLAVLVAVFNVLGDDFADGSDKLVSILVAFGVGFLGVLYARVILELIVVVFKIAEPVTDTARTLHRIEQMVAAGVPVSASGSGGNPATDSGSNAGGDPVTTFLTQDRADSGPGPTGDRSAEPICSNCAAQVGVGEKFCRSCGHGLMGASPDG